LETARRRFAEIGAKAWRDASAIGVSATPTVTVDGVPLQAPDFESVSAAIDIALAKWRTANEADAQGTPGESAQPDASAE
jgi:hypothetical protein